MFEAEPSSYIFTILSSKSRKSPFSRVQPEEILLILFFLDFEIFATPSVRNLTVIVLTFVSSSSSTHQFASPANFFAVLYPIIMSASLCELDMLMDPMEAFANTLLMLKNSGPSVETKRKARDALSSYQLEIVCHASTDDSGELF